MATVTGYKAERIDELMDEQITEAEYNSGTGKLKLTTRGGAVALDEVVRGAQGIQGLKGDPGDVTAGVGWTGAETLVECLDQAKDYAKDKSGLGLVAIEEYAATDITKTGGDDSFHDVNNVSPTYTFVSGRSYRIDFGIHVAFGALSTDDNVVSLDLQENGVTLRRVTIPGDTEGHQSGVTGTHIIKTCPWNGSKTLTMRFQKRTGADVTLKNTVAPSFIAITDLGLPAA